MHVCRFYSSIGIVIFWFWCLEFLPQSLRLVYSFTTHAVDYFYWTAQDLFQASGVNASILKSQYVQLAELTQLAGSIATYPTTYRSRYNQEPPVVTPSYRDSTAIARRSYRDSYQTCELRRTRFTYMSITLWTRIKSITIVIMDGNLNWIC